MTNVTYIYSRLLLGFLVVSTSSYSALIHAASQSRAFFTIETRTTLSGMAVLVAVVLVLLLTLGLHIIIPNQGDLVVMQESV